MLFLLIAFALAQLACCVALLWVIARRIVRLEHNTREFVEDVRRLL